VLASASGLTAALLTATPYITSPALAGVDRPPPLQGEDGCVTYSGQATGGNDATVRLELRLCRGPGDTLTGVTQWSSLVSGWSERRISGSLDRQVPGQLVLKDEEFLESRPEPGWRFCLIDTYELTVDGKSLSGSYVAEDCHDTAKLALDVTSGDPNVLFGPAGAAPAVGTVSPGSEAPQPETPRASETNPTSVNPPGDPKPTPATPEPPPSGCACDLEGDTDGAPPAALLLGLVALALRPRPRSRTARASRRSAARA
jgi:MYXO-CTERM domain-containing protein